MIFSKYCQNTIHVQQRMPVLIFFLNVIAVLIKNILRIKDISGIIFLFRIYFDYKFNLIKQNHGKFYVQSLIQPNFIIFCRAFNTNFPFLQCVGF